jgi:hypothetical protein
MFSIFQTFSILKLYRPSIQKRNLLFPLQGQACAPHTICQKGAISINFWWDSTSCKIISENHSKQPTFVPCYNFDKISDQSSNNIWGTNFMQVQKHAHTNTALTKHLSEWPQMICMKCQFHLLSGQLSHTDLMSCLSKHWPHFHCSSTLLACLNNSHLTPILIHWMYQINTADFLWASSQ